MNAARRIYADTRYGQVHVRHLASNGATEHAPLLCLHPAPSSGLYFKTVMPLLNEGRLVIAPDYPGYGGSDELPDPVSIEDYAGAMQDALDSMAIPQPVDVLGFHTGCLVACEMALASPERVRHLVLCDVPFFTADQQDSLREKMTQAMPVSPELDSLQEPWQFNVTGRIDSVPLQRAFELFAEHLRAGSRDYFGFDAAFRFDCQTRFGRLHTKTTCLATQSALHGPTKLAADLIPNASFVDVPEVTTAVFEAGAGAIVSRITSALDST
ncbi:MAG: alpha/beta hydrolase [Gammaproteobacteria bacterium]|nr:alpha/beta hydrolase [Gammaproteobacteria bacterium]